MIPRKKVYGEYKLEKCPFCGRQATTRNSQKIPVCPAHIKENLEFLKCSCGEFLELQNGKFGVYFRCISCGNVSFSRAMETNGYPLKDIREL